jgi:hypothetical protein
MISFLFGIKHQPTIAKAIKSVLKSLDPFVSKYTGFGHITRDEVMEKHSSPYYNCVLGLPLSSLPLTMDGTYIYIQVRKLHIETNNSQRRSIVRNVTYNFVETGGLCWTTEILGKLQETKPWKTYDDDLP